MLLMFGNKTKKMLLVTKNDIEGHVMIFFVTPNICHFT